MTPGILPLSRPKLEKAVAVRYLADCGVSVESGPALLGIRGYRKRTMGDPDANDRGMYDDLIALVSPFVYLPLNGNTDPSKYADGIASLACGVWRFKWGTHHPGTPGAYKCLVQAEPFTVNRDGGRTETGEFYIHLHHGGVNGTSSLGCQTIPPADYMDFLTLTDREMIRARSATIPYCLMEAP